MGKRTLVGTERRRVRNRHLALSDILGCVVALVLAFSVRFESVVWPDPYQTVFVRFLPILLVVKLALFYRAGLYRRLWRHSGMPELERLVFASAGAAAITFGLGVWLLPALGLLPTRLPISVATLDAVLTVIVAATPRLLIRWFYQSEGRRGGLEGKRVLIAGAGSAGELIVGRSFLPLFN